MDTKLIIFISLCLVSYASAQYCEYEVGLSYYCQACNVDMDCIGNCTLTEQTVSCSLPSNFTYWSCCEQSECLPTGGTICSVVISTTPISYPSSTPVPTPSVSASNTAESSGEALWLDWILILVGCIVVLIFIGCYCVCCIVVVIFVILRSKKKNQEYAPIYETPQYEQHHNDE